MTRYLSIVLSCYKLHCSLRKLAIFLKTLPTNSFLLSVSKAFCSQSPNDSFPAIMATLGHNLRFLHQVCFTLKVMNGKYFPIHLILQTAFNMDFLGPSSCSALFQLRSHSQVISWYISAWLLSNPSVQ